MRLALDFIVASGGEVRLNVSKSMGTGRDASQHDERDSPERERRSNGGKGRRREGHERANLDVEIGSVSASSSRK